MIAAASTWSATSVIWVPASSGISTDGRHDRAVSATVAWKKRWRADALRRLRTASSTPPMTAPRSVIWAKPSSGMTSPSISKDTPVASAAAAATVVIAAPARPDTRVVRRGAVGGGGQGGAGAGGGGGVGGEAEQRDDLARDREGRAGGVGGGSRHGGERCAREAGHQGGAGQRAGGLGCRRSGGQGG